MATPILELLNDRCFRLHHPNDRLHRFSSVFWSSLHCLFLAQMDSELPSPSSVKKDAFCPVNIILKQRERSGRGRIPNSIFHSPFSCAFQTLIHMIPTNFSM